MKRREFIALIGAATTWPLAARAQQGERMRLVAVLMSVDNPEARTEHAAFVQSLKQLGWVDGRNVQIETRWADGTASVIRKNAADVLALAPDAVVASGNNSMGALLQATRTVPIVFA
jgi:putative ABC transport system substrate-binding protein